MNELYIQIVTVPENSCTRLKNHIETMISNMGIPAKVIVTSQDGLVRLNDAYKKPIILIECHQLSYEGEMPTEQEFSSLAGRLGNVDRETPLH